MLVKYWQAALLAAMMALTGNTVWAQDYETLREQGFYLGFGYSGSCCKQEKCCDAKDCCQDGACCKKKDDCKDCSCCKDKDCCKNCSCCKGKDCCKNCACCKGKDCCKNCECCKGKDCACCKSKEGCKESCKCCCATKSKEAKKTVGALIVVVMPGPMMPAYAACPLAPACVFHHVPTASNGFAVVPHPLPPPPPMLTPPGIPVPTMVSPVMPPQTVGLPPPPPPPPTACCPCPPAGSLVCAAPDYPPILTKTNADLSLDNYLSILGMVSDLCCAHLHPTSLPSMCLSSLGTLIDLCPQSGEAVPPAQEPAAREVTLLPPPRPDGTPCIPANVAPPLPIMSCAIATPKPAAPAALKVRIVAQPYSDQLEMSVGDDTCVSCKKMTLTLGDNEVLLTRFDGRVRVRGEELKAKADCVRTDRKDRLILEGNAQLRYRTDDQHASIHAECIELNLATGSVTIKPATESSSSSSPVRFEGGR